jgi:hypothetical protein
MYPEVTDHLSFITIEGHAVFPGFRNMRIHLQEMISQKQQIAFYRLFLFIEVIINCAKVHKL